jgi:hypothetical protein
MTNTNTMKTYRIPVSWEVYGYVTIKAESLSEAVLQAEDAPLPEDASYIEASFRVDHEAIADEIDEN